MDYVYHGSPVKDLGFIEPKMSTHGKSWVYATKRKDISLVFLQKWNDFLLNQSINDNGTQELTERLPNILEDIYKGKGGYLYYLDPTNFLEGQTNFSPEVVSDKREKVIYCEGICDCYEKLLDIERNGKIILFRYPERSNHIPTDDSDLIKRAKSFNGNSKDKERFINYAIEKHPKLKNEFLTLL
jgi:hypothetical protein